MFLLALVENGANLVIIRVFCFLFYGQYHGNKDVVWRMAGLVIKEEECGFSLWTKWFASMTR